MLGPMPRRPAPLPEPWGEQPFSVWRAPNAGVSRKRSRAKDLQAPFYGVRIAAGTLDLPSICRAKATRLPRTAVFSHITAARLHALPLPPAAASDPVLHVCVPTGVRAPRGKRIRGHQRALAHDEFDTRTGIPATTPARTFCDLVDELNLRELVAVGDHLIRRGSGQVRREELRRQVERHAGRHGIERLRDAFELLDEGSESPKESELRVLIIEAGLAKPDCNVKVFDETGRFVARVDLSYRRELIAIEYEGDHHRDKDQWRRDLARRRRLEALGWTYLSVTQADLDDPRAFLSDLRTALGR